MKKMLIFIVLAMLFIGACGSPEDDWLATMEAKPTHDFAAGEATHTSRLTEEAPPSATSEPIPVIEVTCLCGGKEWPTPYPDEMGIVNITEEGCEEYRYYDGIVSEWPVELWDEDTETWAEDYELVRFISFVVTNSVASHNCSQYDPSYDEDYWFWSQHAYRVIEILEYRLYDEKHSTDQGE